MASDKLTSDVLVFQDEEGNPVTTIDFIITPVGKEKRKTITAKNVSGYRVEISNPYVSDSDLEIYDFPKVLFPESTGSIVFIFKPSYDRRKPLAAEFGFDLVIG